MMRLLAVGAGGFLGACLRYGLTTERVEHTIDPNAGSPALGV